MDNTKTILRAIINGQSAMKSELLGEIKKVQKDMSAGFEEMHKIEERLNNRIDKIGYQVANLEDDSPTRDEFDGLEKRVKKLEHKNVLV